MKSNFYNNYPKLKAFLDKHGYVYKEFNDGQQLRIWGATRLVDIWPGRMTFHIIEDEDVIPSDMQKWPKLDYDFNKKQVDALLNGERVKTYE